MEIYIQKQFFIAFIVYMGQILVGYGLGWTAPMIPKLQDRDQTPLPSLVNDAQASWIGSVLYIGTITGPYISGYISNTRGRIPCLVIGGILTVASFVCLAFARNLAMIFTGRIMTGMGTGMIFVINLVYIGEIASTNIRGILLTGTGIFSTFGTLLVYSIGPYTPYPIVSYVGIILSVIYITGLFLLPESPVFLVLQDQQEKAIKSMISLGRNADIDIILKTKPDVENKGQWKDLYHIKSNRKAFTITFVLMILQQLSGIIVVVFFATSIFKMAGSSIEPNIATIVIGVTQLVASSIAPLFVDRSGRKILLLSSTASCSLSLAVLGLYFFLYEYDESLVKHVKWLPLVSLIVFFLSYDLGLGIIPGTLIGEMFQSNVRNSGSAITVTAGWLFGFGVSTAFGYMLSGIGASFTFWIFASSCAVAFLFTAFFVPETKGKSFIDIQQILGR